MTPFLRWLSPVLLCLLALGVVRPLWADESGSTEAPVADPEHPTPAATTPVTAPQPSRKWCDLYISATNPRDVLVIDQDGRYLPMVRQITIVMQIGMRAPSAKLYTYPGLYKPATAQAEVVVLRQMRLIDDAEFQKIVDAGAAAVASKK